jgi:hypothetical protein
MAGQVYRGKQAVESMLRRAEDLKRPVCLSMDSNVSDLWGRLASVRAIQLEVVSFRNPETSGRGVGEVEASLSMPDTILFEEQGSWQTAAGHSLAFKNAWRWTRLDAGRLIRLEHLRLGPKSPVYLIDLAFREVVAAFTSLAPHLCGRDCYQAEIDVPDEGFEVRWFVQGPAKKDLLKYRYI